MFNPIDRVKKFFQVQKYNSELSGLVGQLTDTILTLKKQAAEPEQYLRAVLHRDIEWFDYQKLDAGSKMMYYNDCQNIVTREAFNNEMNRYIADLTKFCATMDGIAPENKLMVLTNLQASIVVLDTFRQRLASIENPQKSKEVSDPFEAL